MSVSAKSPGEFARAAEGEAAQLAREVDAETAGEGNEAGAAEVKAREESGHSKSLPWLQVSILGAMRLSEPVTFYVVFSFLPAWLVAIGVSKDLSTAGYTAGWVESSFAFTQALVVLSWGRLSDRIGRKPVLITGLSGVAISMWLMGFSESLIGIIVTRCIAGASSGNIGVIKSSLGELSTADNQARAFSLLPMIAGVGAAIGPALGGAFAEPAQKFPGLFGGTLFERYEYALPCLISAAYTTLAALLGLFFLRETLPVRKRKRTITEESETPLLDSPQTTPTRAHFDPQPTPLRTLIASAPVRITIGCQIVQVYLSNSILAITPLFAYAPIEAGGLGFNSTKLGAMLGVRGFSLISLQLLFFPALVARFGADRVFRYCTYLYPLLLAGFPLTNALARAGSPLSSAAFASLLVIHASANMQFAANTIIINSLAPTQRDLGTIHGLVQTCMSATKVFSPAIAATLFALSVDKHILGGYLVYIILLGVSGIGVYSSAYIAMPEKTWRDRRLSVSSDS